jgi:hypothetical protein
MRECERPPIDPEKCQHTPESPLSANPQRARDERALDLRLLVVDEHGLELADAAE